MRPDQFDGSPSGMLVPIVGDDPRYGRWEHVAYVPRPLPAETPPLSVGTVRQAERHLGVTYARSNALVGQLVAAGVLRQHDESTYHRRFAAREVLAVLLR